MANSKQIGAHWEREWAKQLKAAGIWARRGRQYCGSPDSHDVESNLNVNWEVEEA